MTPHEEKLVLELHSQWGNRWSRIARRLPGRTDNEIKNYWRTHMRKQAQEKKREVSPSSSSSSSRSSYSSSYSAAVNSKSANETTGSFQSTEPSEKSALQENIPKKGENKKDEVLFSMDDIWKEITSEDEPIKPVYDGYSEGNSFPCPTIASPLWEYCPDTLWRLEEDANKMLFC